MTRADRRRAVRGTRKLGWQLDEFEQQTGRIIEGTRLAGHRSGARSEAVERDCRMVGQREAAREVVQALPRTVAPSRLLPQAFFIAHGVLGVTPDRARARDGRVRGLCRVQRCTGTPMPR